MNQNKILSIMALSVLASCNPTINKLASTKSTQSIAKESSQDTSKERRVSLFGGGQLVELDKEDFLNSHGDMLISSGVTNINRLTIKKSFNESFVRVANKQFNCSWRDESSSITDDLDKTTATEYGQREIRTQVSGCSPYLENQKGAFVTNFKTIGARSYQLKDMCNDSEYMSLETVYKVNENIYKLSCKMNYGKLLNVPKIEFTLDLSREVDEKIISTYEETGYSDVMNRSLTRISYEKISDEKVKSLKEMKGNTYSESLLAQRVGSDFYSEWTRENSAMHLEKDQRFQTEVYLNSSECGDVKSYSDAIVINISEDNLVRYAVQSKELDEDCKPMISTLGKHEIRQDYEKDLIEDALKNNFMLLHKSNKLHELSKSAVIGVGGEFTYDTFKHPISAFSEDN